MSKLTDFGAFVEVAPGVDGLIHISEISYERVPHTKIKWVGKGIGYRASWIHSYEKNECGKVSGWFED